MAAFGIATYLTTSHYLGFSVPCSVTHGCEDVLNSKYSMLLGFPLALWGMFYFFAVVVTSLLANHYPMWKKLLTWLLGCGALSAMVFLSLQFFVIKKVCEYCLTTDLLSILLFIWDLNIEHRV